MKFNSTRFNFDQRSIGGLEFNRDKWDGYERSSEVLISSGMGGLHQDIPEISISLSVSEICAKRNDSHSYYQLLTGGPMLKGVNCTMFGDTCKSAIFGQGCG